MFQTSQKLRIAAAVDAAGPCHYLPEVSVDTLARMRNDWQQRAVEDPLHYIALNMRDPQDFADSAIPDLNVILDGVPTGGRVLEIGAGIGRLLVPLEDRFDELVGVDIAPGMIDLSHDYLVGHPKVKVLVNDGASLPFEDKSFDVVFSYITFQHIPDRAIVERYIADAHRVLKPGGTFRFQVVKLTWPQRVRRPLHLDRATTWTGYGWTLARLKNTLERSSFADYKLQDGGRHLWATAKR